MSFGFKIALIKFYQFILITTRKVAITVLIQTLPILRSLINLIKQIIRDIEN